MLRSGVSLLRRAVPSAPLRVRPCGNRQPSLQVLHRRFSTPVRQTESPAASDPTSEADAAHPRSTWQLFRDVLSAGAQARKAKKAAASAAAASAPVETGVDGKAVVDVPPTLNQAALWRLISFARPEVIPLGVSVATLTLTTGISLLFPYAIGQILDVALNPGAAWNPTNISLGLMALFGVQSGMIVLRSALLAVAGERLAAHMRKHVFACTLAQDIAWFDSQRTGDIINRLSADTVVIQKALTNNIAGGLRSLAMAVGGSGMLVYLSPPLAALSLALIPPVAIAGMYYGRYLEGQQKAVQASLGRATQVAEEIISSMRTVRSFGQEAAQTLRFARRVDSAYESARQIGIVAAYFDGAVHMAANMSLVAVLWYGGTLVSAGGMSAGDLTAFLMYSLYTGFNVANLSSVYTELKRATGAAARIFDITDRAPAMPLSSDAAYWQTLEAQSALTDSSGLFRRVPPVVLSAGSGSRDGLLASSARAVGVEGLRTIPTVRGDLTFKDVTFTYPTRAAAPVLQHFDLSVPSGRTIAIVGGSGSGKSTVGALLMRLYDPTQGGVLLDGVDLRELDPTWLRSSVMGIVAQEPVLFAGSIADNIRFGVASASDADVESVARIAHAHEFISAFPNGYATQVGERGVQMSGGQRARIAIARALIKNPRVLVLDESTAALDASSEAAIVAAMRDISRGRTVITIAHRLSTIKTADIVAVLKDGRIAETGAYDALANNVQSAFHRLVMKQLHGDEKEAAADGGR